MYNLSAMSDRIKKGLKSGDVLDPGALTVSPNSVEIGLLEHAREKVTKRRSLNYFICNK